MYSLETTWESISSYCLERVNPTAFNVWLSIIKPISLDGKIATLHVPNPFQKEIIENNYKKILIEAFAEVIGLDNIIIEIVTDIEPSKTDASLEEKKEIDNTFTFDNFIVGATNRLAHAASQAVSNEPGVYNPLFIYGGSGLGKTHLLYAICNYIKKTRPNIDVTYVKGDEFTNDLIEAIRSGERKSFHKKYRDCHVFLVDDIQFLAGKVQTQEEFFHTFNTLYENKRQIILTSDRPPSEISTLDDRLRNRFESGLMADVSAPDFELRLAIIKQKSKENNFELDNEISEYIATQLKTDIRQLEGAVKKMRAFYSLAGEKPSLNIAQNVIRDVRNSDLPTPITVEKIILEVSRTFNVSPEDIRSSKRSQQVSIARQTAIYIVREITQLSQSMIGKEFGKRDHSSVVYSLAQARDHMNIDKPYKATVSDIIKNIKGQ